MGPQKLTDWINAANGLQYGYDGYGRLTRLTDYDGSHLDYAYDGTGRVTAMTDYHGNTTSYAYDTEGKLTSLTAPGNTPSPQPSPGGRGSHWAYAYDDLKRLTQVTLPNGMETAYIFDAAGRQTAIHHLVVLIPIFFDLHFLG